VKTKKKLQNGDAQVFGGIEGMVSFFFVWCVCVSVGRRIMVWLGSCHARCTRWRSRKATSKRFAAEKISSVLFMFYSRRSCGSEVGKSLFQMKV
jgi:hypothetical protein